MARSQAGRFLLRIEDLDPQRSRREFESSQLADLELLGLDWDEVPVRQSERTGLYDDALAALGAADRLYPCFCTRAEVRQAASAPHGALPEGFYAGTCGDLTPAAARRRVEGGERFALRLRADAELVEFHDRLLGRVSAPVDDFVVLRTDGVHAYQLAVVVDDAAQRIGEVVRGADLAESTPRQILLQRLLELPHPAYAHVPLVLAPDGRRLAKRDHHLSASQPRLSPPALLALLAHSLGLAAGRSRVGSPHELLADFDLARIPREPVTLSLHL